MSRWWTPWVEEFGPDRFRLMLEQERVWFESYVRICEIRAHDQDHGRMDGVRLGDRTVAVMYAARARQHRN